MAIMVFDIETIPDFELARKLYNLPGLSDHEVHEALLTINRQKRAGSEFLPHHLHKVVVISVLLEEQNRISLWSLGKKEQEASIVERFFTGISKYKPTLVSWNGSGFDLPVLHYRAMLHEVVAKVYWETGANDPEFKWNNYLNRYHNRHIDVMDVLSGYQAKASLNDVATMIDCPGKMLLSGGQVLENYMNGNFDKICAYCEIDVINTYLVFLRFQSIRGILTKSNYLAKCQQLKDWLLAAKNEHFDEFVAKWSDECQDE